MEMHEFTFPLLFSNHRKDFKGDVITGATHDGTSWSWVNGEVDVTLLTETGDDCYTFSAKTDITDASKDAAECQKDEGFLCQFPFTSSAPQPALSLVEDSGPAFSTFQTSGTWQVGKTTCTDGLTLPTIESFNENRQFNEFIIETLNA